MSTNLIDLVPHCCTRRSYAFSDYLDQHSRIVARIMERSHHLCRETSQVKGIVCACGSPIASHGSSTLDCHFFDFHFPSNAEGRVAKWKGIGLQSRSSQGSIPAPSSTLAERSNREIRAPAFRTRHRLAGRCDRIYEHANSAGTAS